MSKILIAIYVLFVLLLAIPIPIAAMSEAIDPSLRISVGSETFNGRTYPTVTLENSVQKAVIRTQYGGKNTGGVESVIKDWTLKSVGRDLVSNFVDANSFRGPLSKAVVTNNGADSKTVRLNYALGSIVEYTIKGYDLSLKVKYEKYDVIATSNIVDRPGVGGTTRVYGQGGWLRSITGSYYPCAYWDTYERSLGGCGVSYGPDPTNAGSLNYKGNIIMAYGGADSNGVGIGRVMPIYTGTNGGIKILKIFSDGGFEPYQATARGQLTRPSHVGYIYLFNKGVDNAIVQGQQIVNGGVIIPDPKGISVSTPNGGENWQRGNTKTITWRYTGNPGTNVKIDLLKNGVLSKTIASNVPIGSSGSGQYSWLVPLTQSVGSDYKIRITSMTDAVHTDTSDGNFAIGSTSTPGTSITVISPNGGETWTRGTIGTIEWSSTGIPSTENVDIKIFKGTAQEAHWIKPNTGILNFVLTPTTYPAGTGYTVKITGTGSNSGTSDVSNGSFSMS